MRGSDQPRAPLRPSEWLAVIAAVAIAHGFYTRLLLYPSDFDATGYLEAGADIARNGLFSNFAYSALRTYGYPLFLAGLRTLAGEEAWHWVAFEVQLAVWLLAVAFLRSSLVIRSPAAARWTFLMLMLNPFVLVYAPETLTESLSLSLLVIATACWLHARMAVRNGAMVALMVLGSVILGYAVMVRPANIAAFLPWAGAIGVLLHERRARLGLTAVVVLSATLTSLVPMVPQYVNNTRLHGRSTPLVALNLARYQREWGIRVVKFATALPPAGPAAIEYRNPWLQAGALDPNHPSKWYLAHPGAGVTTAALHIFDILDQDLLFTYSRDLDPWYRTPVGVINHALVGLALASIAFLRRPWRSPRVPGTALAAQGARRSRVLHDAVPIVLFVLSQVALYATTAAEMRFGLALLALSGPVAAWTLWRAARAPWWPVGILLALFVALYIAGALALSDWVRQQSPAIVAWERAHAK